MRSIYIKCTLKRRKCFSFYSRRFRFHFHFANCALLLLCLVVVLDCYASAGNFPRFSFSVGVFCFCCAVYAAAYVLAFCLLFIFALCVYYIHSSLTSRLSKTNICFSFNSREWNGYSQNAITQNASEFFSSICFIFIYLSVILCV